jgi:hypothetical protein
MEKSRTCLGSICPLSRKRPSPGRYECREASRFGFPASGKIDAKIINYNED